MRKLKGRKRLTSLVVAFMLIFIVGAAFAAPVGMLDIVGIVSVTDELDVAWHSYSASNTPGVTATPVRAARPDGNDNQRIVWNISFEGNDATARMPGAISSTLNATAWNHSTQAVTITRVDYSWSNPELANRLGLSLPTPFDSAFLGTLSPGAESNELFAFVNWDPSAFNPNTGDPLEVEFAIEFGYAPE